MQAVLQLHGMPGYWWIVPRHTAYTAFYLLQQSATTRQPTVGKNTSNTTTWCTDHDWWIQGTCSLLLLLCLTRVLGTGYLAAPLPGCITDNWGGGVTTAFHGQSYALVCAGGVMVQEEHMFYPNINIPPHTWRYAQPNMSIGIFTPHWTAHWRFWVL